MRARNEYLVQESMEGGRNRMIGTHPENIQDAPSQGS